MGEAEGLVDDGEARGQLPQLPYHLCILHAPEMSHDWELCTVCCASDHVSVIATMRVKLRRMKITKTVKKLQFDLLRTDDEYTTQFQRHISEHMEGINTIDNVEDRYIKFRNGLTSLHSKYYLMLTEQPNRNG